MAENKSEKYESYVNNSVLVCFLNDKMIDGMSGLQDCVCVSLENQQVDQLDFLGQCDDLRFRTLFARVRHICDVYLYNSFLLRQR